MSDSFDPTDWYWAVADTPGQVYSSNVAAYVALNAVKYVAFLARGNLPTQADTTPNLITVLRNFNIFPYHHVYTSRIVDRLQAQGFLGTFLTVLASSTVYQQQRWATRQFIYADDPAMVTIFNAVGGGGAGVWLAPSDSLGFLY